MKLYVLLIAFILLCTAKSNAQTSDRAKYEVYYRMTFQKDTVENKTMEDFMVLRSNGNKSIFFSKDTYTLDSLLLTSQGEAISMDIIANGTGKYGKRINSYCILKDFSMNKETFTDNMGGNCVIYEEPIPKITWTLIDSTKQIMGYKCQKATCCFRGRNYEAWFTTDLPSNDGPWKFQGLPGLIMEVTDTKRQYVFEFVGLKNSNAEITLLNKDYSKTTREKYLKTYKNYLKDPIGYISASSGLKISIQGSATRQVKTPAARYSPMELY